MFTEGENIVLRDTRLVCHGNSATGSGHRVWFCSLCKPNFRHVGLGSGSLSVASCPEWSLPQV